MDFLCGGRLFAGVLSSETFECSERKADSCMYGCMSLKGGKPCGRADRRAVDYLGPLLMARTSE